MNQKKLNQAEHRNLRLLSCHAHNNVLKIVASVSLHYYHYMEQLHKSKYFSDFKYKRKISLFFIKEDWDYGK